MDINDEAKAAASNARHWGFTSTADIHDQVIEALILERESGGERWTDEQIVDAAYKAVHNG